MKRLLFGLALALQGCGGSGEQFTWDGTWTLNDEAAAILKDDCGCAVALVKQLPQLDIAETGDTASIRFCAATRCIGFAGSLQGPFTEPDDHHVLTASGSFTSLICPDDTAFNASPVDMTFSTLGGDIASLTITAFDPNKGNGCTIKIEGSVTR